MCDKKTAKTEVFHNLQQELDWDAGSDMRSQHNKHILLTNIYGWHSPALCVNAYQTHITRSFLHEIANFYSNISNFDKVMPY